jgi:Ca2+-transporting ATPase
VLITIVVILSLSLLWPFMRNLFRFGPLHADDLTIVLGAGFAVMVLLETAKFAWRNHPRRAATG